MKKPNPSVKARKAANKRGKKRKERLKETQATKHERNLLRKTKKKNQAGKFNEYLNSLMPDPGQM